MRMLLTGLLCLLAWSCNSQVEGYSDMQGLEKNRQKQAASNLVAYMSLETMFANKEVRALAEAAARGDLSRVDELVSSGVDVNSRGMLNATPLFWAMKNFSGFQKLLSLGADPNVIFDDGSNVIVWSVLHNDQRFLAAAIEHGGDVNLVSGERRETPIFKAVTPEGKHNLDLILEANAKIDFRRKNGDTPVMVAAALGQFDVVYKLIAAGASIDIENEFGKTLLDTIRLRRKTMAPGNELTEWMNRVIAVLEDRGYDV